MAITNGIFSVANGLQRYLTYLQKLLVIWFVIFMDEITWSNAITFLPVDMYDEVVFCGLPTLAFDLFYAQLYRQKMLMILIHMSNFSHH